MASNSARQNAIVLQGGGALGAFELGVLKRLYEQDGYSPNVVSGVSIGAITAAVLVGARNGDPLKTLETMWQEFEVFSSDFIPDSIESILSVFGSRNFFRPRSDVFSLATWTSFYDVSPLKETLTKHVSFERIANSDIQLILTATDLKTGRIETFKNGGSSPIAVEHVLASASLPPAFPMTPVGGSVFWDGGLFDNTPLSPVIKALNPDQDTQLVVVNLFSAAGPIPRNMPEVFGRTIQIMLANKFQDNVELTLEVSEYVEVVQALKDRKLATAVQHLAGFKRLERYKLLQNIVYITNTDPEQATAAFDFSKAAIARRIASGYHATEYALTHPLKNADDAKRASTVH
jgi:NTE family protein